MKIGTSLERHKSSHCPICGKEVTCRADDEMWPDDDPRWETRLFRPAGWVMLKGADSSRKVWVCSDKCATAALRKTRIERGG